MYRARHAPRERASSYLYCFGRRNGRIALQFNGTISRNAHDMSSPGVSPTARSRLQRRYIEPRETRVDTRARHIEWRCGSGGRRRSQRSRAFSPAVQLWPRWPQTGRVASFGGLLSEGFPIVAAAGSSVFLRCSRISGRAVAGRLSKKPPVKRLCSASPAFFCRK